jgi:hypothetical protein
VRNLAQAVAIQIISTLRFSRAWKQSAPGLGAASHETARVHQSNAWR